MGTSIGEVSSSEHHVVDVKHHGEQIIIPDGMDIDTCILALKQRREYMSQPIEIRRTFSVFPWDGAYALMKVLSERFGFAMARKIPGGFFRPDQKPQLVDVEIGYKKKVQVPWGRFGIPSLPENCFLETGMVQEKGMVHFALKAQVGRHHEKLIQSIFDDIEVYLSEHSIYQGQAIRIRFRDERGNKVPLPVPEFMDTTVTEDQLIYSRHIEDSIHTNLFTPIRRIPDCQLNGIPVKRGILLGGPFGTGKTMAAQVASNIAVDNGVTFLYSPRADELDDAYRFAQQYSRNGAVVFCEDIDRAMSGERTVKTDDLLNVIDGIDTKNSNIITVLTTNALENIEPAMLRPGRLDSVINITAPDAEAAARLIRAYGNEAIRDDEDLTEVGKVLDGCIPAAIAEVVKRAKLAELRRTAPGERIEHLSADALLEAAQTLQSQLELLNPRPKDVVPSLDRALSDLMMNTFQGTLHAASDEIRQLDSRLSEVEEAVN